MVMMSRAFYRRPLPTVDNRETVPMWVPEYTPGECDALADDHVSAGVLDLSAACTAAGVNGVLGFTGATEYILDRMAATLSGQTLTSVGSNDRAIVKRIDTPTTTLSVAASITDTSISVVDSSVFKVGQYISPVDGSGDGDRDALHQITDITGPVITFGNGLDKGYLIGDSVVLSNPMIKLTTDNDIAGLLIDGNTANNSLFRAWERHYSLWVQTLLTGIVIRNNHFRNGQADDINMHGTGTHIRDNFSFDCSSALIHFSGADGTRVYRNTIVRSNQDAAQVQHSEAAVVWSQGNTDIEVYENVIIDGLADAFGNINCGDVGNEGHSIHENLAFNVARFFYAYGTSTATDPDIDIRDNVGIGLTDDLSVEVLSGVDNVTVEDNVFDKPISLEGPGNVANRNYSRYPQ